jgi:uncharacterized protein (TIGR00369 family)
MDKLKELADFVTSQPGYTSAVGTEVVHVAKGEVHLRLARRPDLLQFHGFFHGGVVAGLADHAAGAAASLLMPPGKIAVTVELKINFMAPASGPWILARAEVLQSGATISVVKVEVFTEVDGAERRCAFCTATMRAVDAPFQRAKAP